MQVCAKLGSNFAEVYNADFKGEFAHADAKFSNNFGDLDVKYCISMQNFALVYIILHDFA